MTKIKMYISKEKLPFYPPGKIKCELQNRMSKRFHWIIEFNEQPFMGFYIFWEYKDVIHVD